MKKFFKTVFIITLSLVCFACANNVNANQANISETSANIIEKTDNNTSKITTNDIQNTNTEIEISNTTKENILTTKFKNLCNKETVKKIFNGQSVSSFAKEKIQELSIEERESVENEVPELSLAESNFENDEKTYQWLSDSLKVLLKYLFDNGYVTQQQIDEFLKENEMYLKLIGISIPDVKIKKGMQDEDIEKIAITVVDLADKITEPIVLKLLNIDLSDPNLFENIQNTLNNN